MKLFFGKIKFRTIFFALCVAFIVYLVFHSKIFEGMQNEVEGKGNANRISGDGMTASPGSKCTPEYYSCIKSGAHEAGRYCAQYC